MKEFLTFIKRPRGYMVLNKRNQDILGQIYYYEKWKRWVFESFEDSFFSIECLEQISGLVKALDLGDKS